MSKKFQRDWEKQQSGGSFSSAPPSATASVVARIQHVRQQGGVDQGITIAKEHLESSPADHVVLELLGTLLLARNRVDEAEEAFSRIIEAKPGYVKAHVWLSGIRASRGDRDGAVAAMVESIAPNVQDPTALREIGDALIRLGAVEEALEPIQLALALRPQDPQLLFKKARALQMLHRGAEAIEFYEQTLRIRRDIGAAYSNIGAILAESGMYEEARQQFQLAIKYSADGAGNKFRMATLLPVIAESNDQIETVRGRVRNEVQNLKITGQRLHDPNMEVGAANFYLAYQGRPDKELQLTIARSYVAACSSLQWKAPTLARTRSAAGRIKLGFCSAFFHEHTIAHVVVGLIEKLDREKFEVLLLRSELPGDPMAHRLDAAVDSVIQLGGTLADSREYAGSLGLDILFYTDVGMDAFTYFLSYARLAPVQIVGWGHPDTTGIPNLDYYLSSDTFEPEGTEEHYSEQLIRLPRIYAYLERPAIEPSPMKKAELGIPEDANIYLCAQTLFKVHPDFDGAVAGILRSDPKARVLFFETSEPKWVELLRARFEKVMPDCADRISFLPRLSPADFRRVLMMVEAVIDTKHFTGGYTAYLALASGAPIVTWKGELMRGRMTHGLYRQIGIEGLSAESDEEFVRIATRLATDPEFRTLARTHVADRSHVLFEDEGAVRHFEDFLIQAHEAALDGKKLTQFVPQLSSELVQSAPNTIRLH